jgi:C_GCAxxG_C_C family probable redox protein
MTERQEKAKAAFLEGHNCAQSVLLAFNTDIGLKDEDLLRISSGFGSGMGRMQETCGALTGGMMVISYLYGKFRVGDHASKELSIEMIGAFVKTFRQKHKETSCRKLLGLDLGTEEGRNEASEDPVYKKKCTAYVTDAVEILERDILKFQ